MKELKPDTAGNTPELCVNCHYPLENHTSTTGDCPRIYLGKAIFPTTWTPPQSRFSPTPEPTPEPKHILGMEPDSVLRQIIRNHFSDQPERAIGVEDIVTVAMRFNKWLLETNNTLQSLTLDRLNTTLPSPVIIHAAPSQEAANISGDAFNLIGLLRSVVACGEKLNKDDDAEISRVLHALRVARDKAEPAPSPATKDTHFLDFDQIAIELACELYDRFVMGGWGPEDVYSEIMRRLQVWHEAATKDTRELIWLVELFHNGKSQSRTPTNLESRTEPDDLRIWAHTESLRADVAEARLKDLESRTVAPQLEKDMPICETCHGEFDAERARVDFNSLDPLRFCSANCAGTSLEAQLAACKLAYGKLFNENAALQGRLEEALAGAAALPSTPKLLIELRALRNKFHTEHMLTKEDTDRFDSILDQLTAAASVPAASSPTKESQR